jgi:peptidyl-prolyl cis-trans isomerase SurA
MVRLIPQLRLLLLIGGVLALGCSSPDGEGSVPDVASGTSGTASPDRRTLGVADSTPALGMDRRQVPGGDVSGQAACREILIRYRGAVGAGESVTRSKDEARDLARELLADLEAGADFVALVGEHSEGLSVDRDGFIPPFPRGLRPRAFEDAAFSLGEGDLSEVVETPWGFHILLGEDGQSFLANMILISHADSPAAPSRIERGRLEALRLASQLRDRLVAHPDSFAVLARKHSDGEGKEMGGRLAMFNRYSHGKYFGDVVASLEVGEVSEVFETRQGYNIIQRVALP